MMKKSLIISFILCSLLLTTSAYPAVNWQKFSYFKNYGGLNDNLSSTEIEDNEATDLQNVVFDTGGQIKKRNGYLTVPNNAASAVSSGTVAITGLSFFKLNNGDRYIFGIINVGTQAYAIEKDYSTGALTTGSWLGVSDSGLLPSSYSNDYLPSFATAQNELVFTIPSVAGKKPYVWTGSGALTTLTADADCPTASLLAYHKNILFLSGNITYPSRIYFSAVGDITNYTNTDFFDVDASDGTKVRALLSVYNSLYIFKDKSIWCLTGDNRDNFVLQRLVSGIGTLSQQSIAVVNNIVYFTTSQNDIAVYDGAYTVKFLSQKIRNTIAGLNFSRATNNLGLAYSSYKHNDNDYYCAVSGAGIATNNKVLLFDTQYNAWTKFSGLNPNAWCVAEDSVGKNVIVFGDYSGFVYSYPSTTYYDRTVTGAISAFYQTKWFRYPDVSLSDKYWRLLKTYALTEETTNTFLTTECRSDYEQAGRTFSTDISQSGSTWDSAVWDTDTWSGQTLLVDRREVEKGKNMFQLKYSNNAVSQGFTIFGFENFIEPANQI